MTRHLTTALRDTCNLSHTPSGQLIIKIITTAAHDALRNDRSAIARSGRRYFLRGLWRKDVRSMGGDDQRLEGTLRALGLPLMR